MKPADIVVGTKYRHKNYADTLYLGIGERDSYNHKVFRRKKLIIIDDIGCVGAVVASPKKCTNKEFWNGFYPT